jgi:hypothetical protein
MYLKKKEQILKNQFNKKVCSGPTVGNLNVLSFCWAACILLSGMLFSQMERFMKFMGMKCFHEATFFHWQRWWFIPVVNEYVRDHFEKQRARFNGKPVKLLMDGRFDTPGHTATKCTYGAMDQRTSTLLGLYHVDFRRVQKIAQRYNF